MVDPTEDELPEEWEHTAKLARNGDTEAIHDILREIADGLERVASMRNAPIPWECAHYVAEAFREILDPNPEKQLDPMQALGLKERKAGRPKGAKTHDEVRLAAAYWLMLRRGLKPERANQLLQRATGADRTTIQRAARGCSAFEDGMLYDDRLLVSIISEQPSLATLISSL